MQFKGSIKCRSGDGCEVGGEISGTLPLAPKGDFAKALATVIGSVDAGAFTLDVSDSTVTVPTTGYVTVKLIDSSTGSVQASKVFPWIRSGTLISLADPMAVNVWAEANAGSANSVEYNLHKFQTSESPGWNTLAVASNYEGQTEAYATTTWRYSQICPNDPLRKQKDGPGASDTVREAKARA